MIVLNPLLIGQLQMLQGLAAASSVVTSPAHTQCVGENKFAHRLSSEDIEPTTPSADAGKRSSHRLKFFGDALHIARAIIAGAYDRVRNFSAPDNCGGMAPALAFDSGIATMGLQDAATGIIWEAKMVTGKGMLTTFLSERKGTEPAKSAAQLRIEENCPPEEVDKLHRNLLEYERRFCTPEFTEPISHNFMVKNADGDLVGGVDFVIVFGISYVRNIWVREDYRGQGIASELMKQVEDFSREQGAVYVALDTMDFEAPDFYRRIGYELEHERKKVYGDHSQFSFRKRL